MRNGNRVINYTTRFNKQFRKAPLPIKRAFRQRLALFLREPGNPLLRIHPLAGPYRGFRSFNVTGDWRAVYLATDTTLDLHAIGTHSQLYGR